MTFYSGAAGGGRGRRRVRQNQILAGVVAVNGVNVTFALEIKQMTVFTSSDRTDEGRIKRKNK